METLTGREIRGYEVRDPIGSGGFGAVYRAYQSSVDRDVAIKVILPEFATHPDFVKRFESEARLVAKLEHPHIVPLHDFWHDDSGAYLVMRWLRGGSLRDRIGAGPLDLEQTARILDQIAAALDSAHEQGVIHRDLKPENILLDRRGDAYLTDFGLAKDLSAPGFTAEGQVMGSVAYLAPEQAKAELVTPQTDIYALGLVLYELLTSKHPFGEINAIQLVQKHLNEPLPSLSVARSGLPAGLDEVIQRATAKDARGRYPNAESLRSAYESAVYGESAPVFPMREAREERLPLQPTAFLGREAELARVSELLEETDCRLLTLVGPGGIGKTRLSLRAAEAALEGYPDGVFFVPLSPVNSPDFIASAIANAIDMTFFGEQEPSQQLISHLRDKQALLVLDSFEHLLEGATQVAVLLESCPALKAIVTSRERLNLQIEKTFDVRGMPIPALAAPEAFEGAPLTQLFVHSARRVDAGFSISKGDLPSVVRICELASGIPLAVELAAAWVSVLSCGEIALELERNLDLLVTSMRDVPERHRSMRAAFEHSWKLLSEDEQAAFRALSVFQGGFSREAAREVAGASLMVLARLADKSMLRRDAQDTYQIHELLRQFGFELLQQSGAAVRLQDAHLDYFLEFAGRLESGLKGADQSDWFNLAEREHDNIRHALSWALRATEGTAREETRTEKGIRLAAAMGQFWDTRGYLREAEEWLQRALDVPGRPSAGRVRALLWAGLIARRRSDYQSWISRVDESLKLARQLDDSAGIAEALLERARITNWKGKEIQQVEALCSESAALWKALGDRRGVARALGPLARLARDQHDHERAMELFQESLALFREVGDVREIAGALWNLSEVSLRANDLEAAGEYAREGLTLYQNLGDKHGIATMLRSLGEVASGQLKPEDSADFYVDSVEIFRDLRDEHCAALSLMGLGEVTLNQGRADRAKGVLEESLSVFRKTGDRTRVSNVLTLQARAALMQDDHTGAVQLIRQGLQILQETGSDAGLSMLIEELASARLTQGNPEQAAVLWGAAEALREVAELRQHGAEHARRDRQVADARQALGSEGYQEAWKQGYHMTTDQIVEFALSEATGD